MTPICNQNTDGIGPVDWYDEDGNFLYTEEPTVNCGAGGRGGDAGDAGVSEAGDGGLAFTVAFA